MTHLHLPPHPAKAAIAALLTAALLSACGGSGGSGDEPANGNKANTTVTPTAFDAARARWVDSGLQDYRYTFRQTCFCVPEEEMLVIVRAGVIQSATYQPSGNTVPAQRLKGVPTVPGLFKIIDDALAAHADQLDATYHAGDGHPEQIFIDYSRLMADEEMGYTVTRLDAL